MNDLNPPLWLPVTLEPVNSIFERLGADRQDSAPLGSSLAATPVPTGAEGAGRPRRGAAGRRALDLGGRDLRGGHVVGRVAAAGGPQSRAGRSTGKGRGDPDGWGLSCSSLLAADHVSKTGIAFGQPASTPVCSPRTRISHAGRFPRAVRSFIVDPASRERSEADAVVRQDRPYSDRLSAIPGTILGQRPSNRDQARQASSRAEGRGCRDADRTGGADQDLREGHGA